MGVSVDRQAQREPFQHLRPASTVDLCRLVSGARISRQLMSFDYPVSSISSSWIILNKANVTFHQVDCEAMRLEALGTHLCFLHMATKMKWHSDFLLKTYPQCYFWVKNCIITVPLYLCIYQFIYSFFHVSTHPSICQSSWIWAPYSGPKLEHSLCVFIDRILINLGLLVVSLILIIF